MGGTRRFRPLRGCGGLPKKDIVKIVGEKGEGR